MIDTPARLSQLKQRQLELMARLNFVDQELSTHGNPDWQDNAIEREDDETLEALGHAAQSELRMIEAALKRIEQAEYGYCVRCGTEISAQRLDLLPATPFCRTCVQ